MKIDPAAPQRPATARRTGNPGPGPSGGFAKALGETAATAGPETGRTGPIGAAGTVLAAQEVADPTERRRRARRRGEDILDRLEDVRLGLLLGTVSQDRLRQLAQMLRAAREDADDPRLEAVIDEIELRAAVELAKLSR